MDNQNERADAPFGAISAPGFKKLPFPLIQKASPRLISLDIVSVQPMTSTVGGIDFYRKTKKTPLQELAERVWSEKDPTDEDIVKEEGQEEASAQDKEDPFTRADRANLR